jgi:hypothetical protein
MNPQTLTYWEILRIHLRQPEYLHVALHGLPIFGLAIGAATAFLAALFRNRGAQIAGLLIILFAAASAWPLVEFGEKAYDGIEAIVDRPGYEWLDAHAQRGTKAAPVFYAMAAVALAATLVAAFLPRAAAATSIVTSLLAVAAMCAGVWVASAGGPIRHKEFRTGKPPEKPGEYEKMRE